MAFLLPPLALTSLVYGSLVRNYFHDDDFLNLYRIVNRPLLEYLLEPHAGHLLVTRNSVFALSYYLFGPRPEFFFSVVLLTHLANVALLFCVIRGFTGSAQIACFGAALWGASPLHEVTLGWYSVYGQVLVGTVLLVFFAQLDQLAKRRLRQVPAAVWVLLLLAAATSFGLGLAIAVLSPAVAFLVLPPGPGRRRAVFVLVPTAAAIPLLYLGLHYVASLYQGSGTLETTLNGLNAWRRMGVMLWQLTTYAGTYLPFSPLRTSIALPALIPPALVVVATAGLVISFPTTPSLGRRQLLACVIVCLSCYCLIAAGRGQLLNARRLSDLEQVRYHYVATIPLTLALCLTLRHLTGRIAGSTWSTNGTLAAWFVAALIVHSWFGLRLSHQDYARRETTQAVSTIRERIAAQPPGSTVTIPNRSFVTVGSNWIPRTRFPGWAGVFTIFFDENVVNGRRVVFSDPDPNVVAAAAGGRRSAGLIVQGEQVVKPWTSTPHKAVRNP